jgi:hypothetical protein
MFTFVGILAKMVQLSRRIYQYEDAHFVPMGRLACVAMRYADVLHHECGSLVIVNSGNDTATALDIGKR